MRRNVEQVPDVRTTCSGDGNKLLFLHILLTGGSEIYCTATLISTTVNKLNLFNRVKGLNLFIICGFWWINW